MAVDLNFDSTLLPGVGVACDEAPDQLGPGIDQRNVVVSSCRSAVSVLLRLRAEHPLEQRASRSQAFGLDVGHGPYARDRIEQRGRAFASLFLVRSLHQMSFLPFAATLS